MEWRILECSTFLSVCYGVIIRGPWCYAQQDVQPTINVKLSRWNTRKTVKYYNRYVLCQSDTRTEKNGFMYNRIHSSKIHNITKIENIETDNAKLDKQYLLHDNNIWKLAYVHYTPISLWKHTPVCTWKMSMYLQCFVNKISMIHRNVKKVKIRNRLA